MTLEHAIENIDIGGPSMLRSAAKNYRSVTVITDPADYAVVAGEIAAQGDTTLATRERLAAKVFRTTGYYDSLIAELSQRSACPSRRRFPRPSRCRCAARRRCATAKIRTRPPRFTARSPSTFQQLHGKELSYNNLIDINAAVRLIREFTARMPTVAILKHTNPCGVGSGAIARRGVGQGLRDRPAGAVRRHHRGQPPARSGHGAAHRGNLQRGHHRARLRRRRAALLSKKKNLRLMVNGETSAPAPGPGDPLRGRRFVSRPGRRRRHRLRPPTGKSSPSARRPTAEREALLFGWRVVKHVKSNAIVYAAQRPHAGHRRGPDVAHRFLAHRDLESGRGQAPLQGSIVASDAFFPFPDGLIAAAEAGATAAIQPGGSVSDPKVIAAADERGWP